jgi:putative hemolysin
MRLFGFRYKADRASLTEDEINLIIAEGREKGVFDATEQEMIHSVFDFTDTTARQAMTPRTDIIGVDINENSDEILKKIISHGFSRFPVYENTLDNIIGILYAKDIIKILQDSAPIVINDIIRKPLFIPDSMMLNMLLKTFQQKRVHVAIVLDEFGGTAGLITLEDILEEIVGEIHDEYDLDQREFVKNSDTLAFVAASLRVDELNDQFNTRLPENGPDTIGGLVFENLGHPAAKGEIITIKNIKFTVLELEDNRLKRLRVEKLSTNQA